MSDPRDTLKTAARRWWWSMNFEGGGNPPRRKGGAARAALAELRHARSNIEVFLVPAALDLFHKLTEINGRVSPDRVAAVAVALANLKPESDLTREKPVSRAIGRKSFAEKDKDSAAISEGRFRRLLQAEQDELLDAFRRLVRQMGGRLDPGSLAESILHWDDATKQRWIFDYYAAGIAAPTDPTTENTIQEEDHHG